MDIPFELPHPKIDTAILTEAQSQIKEIQDRAINHTQEQLVDIGRQLDIMGNVAAGTAQKSLDKIADKIAKVQNKAMSKAWEQGSYIAALAVNAGIDIPPPPEEKLSSQQFQGYGLYQNDQSGCWSCIPAGQDPGSHSHLFNLFTTQAECTAQISNYSRFDGQDDYYNDGYKSIATPANCQQGGIGVLPVSSPIPPIGVLPISTNPSSKAPTNLPPPSGICGTTYTSGDHFIIVRMGYGIPFANFETTKPDWWIDAPSPQADITDFPTINTISNGSVLRGSFGYFSCSLLKVITSDGGMTTIGGGCLWGFANSNEGAYPLIASPFSTSVWQWNIPGGYNVGDIAWSVNSGLSKSKCCGAGAGGTSPLPPSQPPAPIPPPTIPPPTPPPPTPCNCCCCSPCQCTQPTTPPPPTPPPTPPPPPVDDWQDYFGDDADDSPDIPITTTPIAPLDPDVCDRISAFRLWAIDIGKQILGTLNYIPPQPPSGTFQGITFPSAGATVPPEVPSLSVNVIWSVLVRLGGGLFGTQEVAEHLAFQLNKSPLIATISQFEIVVSQALNYDPTIVRPLLALRALLHNMLELEVSGAYHFKDEVGISTLKKVGAGLGTGTSIGKLADAGLKVGAEVSMVRTSPQGMDTMTTSKLRPILLPPLRILDYVINQETQHVIPEPHEAMEMYHFGVISENHLICLCRYAGERTEYIKLAAYAKREKLHPKEAIQYIRRVEPDQTKWGDLCHGALRLLGFLDPKERTAFITLYDEIPTIQDHLGWLRRNVDFAPYVAEFGLWQGYDTPEETVKAYTEAVEDAHPGASQTPEFQGAMNDILTQPPNPNFKGRNFYQTFGKDLRSRGLLRRASLYHYLAHWVNPSPGQAAEMLQRLRPKRVQQIVDKEVADGTLPPNTTAQQRLKQLSFTAQRYARVLAEQDIGVGFIDLFRYIAYPPPSIRFLRELYSTGVWSPDEAYEALQDLGYSPDNAKVMGRALEIRRRRDLATTGHGWTVQELSKLYQEGLIDIPTFNERMEYLGFPDFAIGQARDRCTEDFKREQTRARAKSLHECYMHGRVPDDLVYPTLTGLGYSPDRAESMVETWKEEKLCRAEQATKGELINAYKHNLIDAPTLAQRLLTLNYQPDTVSLLVAIAVIDKSKALQALIEKQNKDIAKAREKLAKALERQIKQAQKRNKKLHEIQLNLDKALRRADLVVDTADIKAQALLDVASTKDAVEKAGFQGQALVDIGGETATNITADAYESHSVSSEEPL